MAYLVRQPVVHAKQPVERRLAHLPASHSREAAGKTWYRRASLGRRGAVVTSMCAVLKAWLHAVRLTESRERTRSLKSSGTCGNRIGCTWICERFILRASYRMLGL